VVLNKAADKTL